MRSLIKSLLWSGLLASQTVYAGLGDSPTERDAIEEELENPTTSANINVDVSVSFPQAELFGIKLVNNHLTEAVVSFTNKEPSSVINVRFIGGSLWSIPAPDQSSRIIRNFTSTMYNGAIPAGESDSFSYKFGTEMHPQDVLLNIAALVTDEKQNAYTLNAFNGTASIVEAPTSFFDPQIIFLYLILAGLFAGTSYFIYSTWISTLFPQAQKKRTGVKDVNRVKTPKGAKTAGPADQVSVAGGDGPAVTSGAAAYDASWIPAHHIQRPEAKRIRSGTPTGVKTKKAA